MEWRLITILQHSLLVKQGLSYPGVCVRHFVNLSYRIIGDYGGNPDKPPILMFHGLLGNKKSWKSIAKTIVNVTKRLVINVDLRNHGESPHSHTHKYEEMALDILQLMEKLQIKRASLFGHSVGGRAAMCVALMEPPKVAGLLVVDVSPVSTSTHMSEHFPKLLAAMKNVDFKQPKKVSTAIREARRQLKNTIDDELTLKTVLTNIKIKPNGTIGWTCNLDVLINQFNQIVTFPESLKKKVYKGPTYFIGGQLSEFIPADDLNLIREMFPRAVIRYVPKTGHNVHQEDPHAFMVLAIAFLKTN